MSRGEQRHAVAQPEDERRRRGGRPRWCRARRRATTAMEKAPRTARERGGASPRPAPRPAASCSSIRWAITSVSVAEVKMWPSAARLGRSSAWFSMIPLWIDGQAAGAVDVGVGVARPSGAPWVAQRVCPMPGGAPPRGAVGQLPRAAATESVPARPGPATARRARPATTPAES